MLSSRVRGHADFSPLPGYMQEPSSTLFTLDFHSLMKMLPRGLVLVVILYCCFSSTEGLTVIMSCPKALLSYCVFSAFHVLLVLSAKGAWNAPVWEACCLSCFPLILSNPLSHFPGFLNPFLQAESFRRTHLHSTLSHEIIIL